MTKSCLTLPRTIPNSANPLKDKRTLTKEVALCLQADFSHRRSHLKIIARHAEASPRSVEAWTGELCLPGFEYIARLAEHSPSIKKLFLRLMSFDPDTDPEAHRALQELRRAIK